MRPGPMTPDEIETYKLTNPWTRLTVIFHGSLHRPPRALELTRDDAQDLAAMLLSERRATATFLGPVWTLDGTTTVLNWNGIEELILTPISPARRDACGLNGCVLPAGHPDGQHVGVDPALAV